MRPTLRALKDRQVFAISELQGRSATGAVTLLLIVLLPPGKQRINFPLSPLLTPKERASKVPTAKTDEIGKARAGKRFTGLGGVRCRLTPLLN
jgi:hypothetical protein